MTVAASPSGVVGTQGRMRCAVVTPVGPGHEALYESCRASVVRAFERDSGAFETCHLVRIDDAAGRLGRSRARNLGVAAASAQGADWIFFLDADDVAAPEAFRAVAPYLGDHDGVWGLISSFENAEVEAAPRAGQVESFDDLRVLLLAHPFDTLQMGHFVRTEAAKKCPFDEARDCGEDFDYYVRMWTAHRCRKIPAALFHNRRGRPSGGPRAARGAAWERAATALLADACWRLGLTARIDHHGRTARFRIRDPFDRIQRKHASGRFFEEDRLDFLASRVRRASVIVEAGANVGNHAVYYSLFLAPRRIVVMEPSPEAAPILMANLALNESGAFDRSHLGVGLAAKPARFSIDTVEEHNLGASRLVPDPAGAIEAAPLDFLEVGDAGFVKIDVEGMELEVLQGARRTLERSRPDLLVEVLRENLDGFRALLAGERYRIERCFESRHAVDVFAVPAA